MPKVELRLGVLQWPDKCCRCDSKNSKRRTHTEKVVTKSVLVASEYREISLENVPMCDRCAAGKAIWFFGAGVAAALATVILYFFSENDRSSAVLWLYGLAVALAIVATGRGPLRILSLNEATNAMHVKLYSHEVAKEMKSLEAMRPELPEHSEHLRMHEEKRHQQKRQLVGLMRTICCLGIGAGLYILLQSNTSEGLSLLIIFGAIWIPFELLQRRAK